MKDRDKVFFNIPFFCIVLFLMFQSCALFYNYPDINNYEKFPYTTINHGNSTYLFKAGNSHIFDTLLVKGDSRTRDTVYLTLDEFLKTTKTAAFVVIRNDSILFENYYNGYERSQIMNVFSISKSVTSLLVGLAVQDGYIKSVHDPITDYIPELLDGDERFQRLTIEHLLDMRSGLKFNETYSTRFSKMAKLYYGKDQLGQIKKMKFAHEPGTVNEYQSVSTALLGIALEKVTGKEFGKYLEEKVWIPLGMEFDATWSLDDEKRRSAKAYQGLNITAIDLAKIGRLYLNEGKWNGKQIINPEWIKKSTTPNVNNEGYQYQWYNKGYWYLSEGKFFPDTISAKEIAEKSEYKYYSFEQYEGQWRIIVYTDVFYAAGYLGQMLYVNPEKNLIMVRIGNIKDCGEIFFDRLNRKL
jgi:CubicO group peptidase (beta-lactamase class C family)